MYQTVPPRKHFIRLTWIVLILLVSLPVFAADLSGQYFGFDRAEGHTLNVEQLGTQVSGGITGPDWRLEFSGANDGSNMANVGVTLWSSGTKQNGFMIMRWQPTGIQLSLIIKTDRAISGQYHFSVSEPSAQKSK